MTPVTLPGVSDGTRPGLLPTTESIRRSTRQSSMVAGRRVARTLSWLWGEAPVPPPVRGPSSGPGARWRPITGAYADFTNTHKYPRMCTIEDEFESWRTREVRVMTRQNTTTETWRNVGRGEGAAHAWRDKGTKNNTMIRHVVSHDLHIPT